MDPDVSAPRAAPIWLRIGGPLVTGVLLGLAGPPLEQPVLLLPALIPLLAVLLHPAVRPGGGVLAAVGAAFVHNLLRGLVLQFPLGFALLLGVSLSLLWAPLGAAIPALMRRLPRSAALVVVPAAVVAVEFLGVSLVPVFGTAESFGRALAPWPLGLAPAAFAGFAGPVALLALAQTAAVVAWYGRRDRRTVILGLAGVVLAGALFAVAGAVRLGTSPTATVRVAAVGWTYADEGSPWSWEGNALEQLAVVLAPHVRTAADDGAQLVVAPEAAFAVSGTERDALLSAVGALARETGATLVIGYFDGGRGVNEAALITPREGVVAVYRKTHLIPFMEDYTAGTGERIAGDSPVGALGMLICQDDNFPDLARGYARDGVAALAIPTNDWELVEGFHLQNTVLRAADSGVAIIRGATNGISAVIDARGRVLGRRPHHQEGTGAVVVDLPLHPPGSPFAYIGNALPVACLVVLAAATVLAARRRR